MARKNRVMEDLARLKAKYKGQKYALPFPDLSTQPSPCSNKFDKAEQWSKGQKVEGVTITHLHKSTYQVLPANEVKYAGKKV